MFNLTSSRLRRTRKILILSLNFVCFANSLCMEPYFAEASDFVKTTPDATKVGEGNKPNPITPVDSEGNQIIVEKNGLLSLPIDILLETIKFCAEAAENEQELKNTVFTLGKVNKYFKQFIRDQQLLLFANKILERIKNKFYQNNNLMYKQAEFGIHKGLIITRDGFLKQCLNFAAKKYTNVEKIKDKTKLLFQGAKEGDYEQIILALSNGANIDEKEEPSFGKGRTALMWAAEFGHKKIVDLLINCGAKVDEKNKEGSTALMCAAASGYKEIVALLIEKGANIDEKENPDAIFSRGRTALIWAAVNGYKEIVALLIEKGANIDEKDKRGCTPLMHAANSEYSVEMAELLIEKGANINTRTYYVWTLRSLTGEPNWTIASDCNWTPLMYAAHKGYKKMVELLLANGAEVTSEDIKKINTTLFFKTEMVKFLESYLKQKENSSQNNTATNRRASKTCSCTIS